MFPKIPYCNQYIPAATFINRKNKRDNGTLQGRRKQKGVANKLGVLI